MTYAALIENQSQTADASMRQAPSQSRRETDKTKARHSGRRWSDHVEIEVVGSDHECLSETVFVTTAFAAQVLGQITNRPSGKNPAGERTYQVAQKPNTAKVYGNLVA